MNENDRRSYCERRSYYRINDVVGVKFAVITNSMEGPEQEAEEMAMLLPDLMEKIDQELNGLQPSLQRANPAIARSVELLNRKLQILSSNKTHAQEERDLGASEVSLSAGGIAFSTLEPIEPGTILGLALNLEMEEEPIRMLGRVVGCETKTSSASAIRHWLRIEFSDPDQALCQRLADYVLSKKDSAPAAHGASLNSLYSKELKSNAYSL